jgi:Histidine kinase-, DNA gyrase B-, and HSP90-like ATPase
MVPAMSERILVTVENDHLEALARPSRSLAGIAELIWNALDAEAESVVVSLAENELGGVGSVRVIDDGHGMRHADAREEFAHLGGSWKLRTNHSKNRKRLLHGKRGQGRWRAFSIGSFVRWTSVAEEDGRREQTTITGARGALTQFELSDPVATDEPIGTTVVIENIEQEPASALLADDAADKLTAMLAPYLERYPNVSVEFRARNLDPGKLQEHRAEYDLDLPEADYGPLKLTVIEWNRRFPRELLLCDQNGITLHVEHPGIQAPAFDFTAYASWHGFREHEPELVTTELHPVLAPALEAARAQLREHFRVRGAELQASVIEDWKREEVYPYKEEAASEIERVERDLFDVVAANAAKAVNSATDRVGKRFSLTLLRQAVEQSPSALRRVLHEVLELPADKLAELDELLERTSLTSIIALGKVVADRLDFLAGLRELVFDPQTKKAVLERSQLHRILANEVWLFGDQYTLAVDDEGLSAVLQQHIKILGREVAAEDVEPAALEDGSRAIVDLLLAAAVPLPTQQHEHLVVELKRPSLKLGHEELTQISRYADAVARDARFNKVDVRWNFWLIGTEMSEYVQGQASQPHLPPGVVSRPLDGRVTIWVKTWSQILDDCEHRLKFVKEKLDYRSSRDAGVEYLRQQHEKYLPEALRSSPAPASPTPAATS